MCYLRKRTGYPKPRPFPKPDSGEPRTCVTCGEVKSVTAFRSRNRNRRRNGIPFVYVHVPKECGGCENQKRLAYHYSPEGEAKDQANRRLRHQRDWNSPEKRQKHLDYYASPQGREVVRKYENSEHGKIKKRAWLETEKGQEYLIAKWQRHRLKREMCTTCGDPLTLREWRAIRAAYQGHCAYCDRNDVPMTLDHIIPITKGGPHHRTNVVPACWGCNMAKKATSRVAPTATPNCTLVLVAASQCVTSRHREGWAVSVPPTSVYRYTARTISSSH